MGHVSFKERLSLGPGLLPASGAQAKGASLHFPFIPASPGEPQLSCAADHSCVRAAGVRSLGRLLGRRDLGYELGLRFLETDVRSYSPNISLLQLLKLWVQVKLASLLHPQEG